jgi:hypothetical protein
MSVCQREFSLTQEKEPLKYLGLYLPSKSLSARYVSLRFGVNNLKLKKVITDFAVKGATFLGNEARKRLSITLLIEKVRITPTGVVVLTTPTNEYEQARSINYGVKQFFHGTTGLAKIVAIEVQRIIMSGLRLITLNHSPHSQNLDLKLITD